VKTITITDADYDRLLVNLEMAANDWQAVIDDPKLQYSGHPEDREFWVEAGREVERVGNLIDTIKGQGK
jgi:hypothetical protein